jgi:hypothetical protein
MKINFGSILDSTESELIDHAEFLAAYEPLYLSAGFINSGREPPHGYEGYVCVDVLGPEFVWMNEYFSKEEYTWYLWFESIFLVTPEMATFLALRWS